MCEPRVMGAPSLSLRYPQMSATAHLSLMLARLFRKSPAVGVWPRVRHSGPRNSPHSAGSLSLHPFVVNELPHPHLHCASLSVLESLMSLSRGATTRCRGWRRGLGPVHSLCTPSANPAVFSPSFRESHCLHF